MEIFTQGMTFEEFVAQFQANTTKILCIINGTTLRYYDEKNLPQNLTFQSRFKDFYYYRSDDSALYCFFKDLDIKNIKVSKRNPFLRPCNQIIIHEKTGKYIFTENNFPLVSKEIL